MNISKREIGNCVVLDCSGKITLGPATMTVRNAVREAAAGGAKRIILNLGDVNYVDSSGIGELVSSAAQDGWVLESTRVKTSSRSPPLVSVWV